MIFSDLNVMVKEVNVIFFLLQCTNIENRARTWPILYFSQPIRLQILFLVLEGILNGLTVEFQFKIEFYQLRANIYRFYDEKVAICHPLCHNLEIYKLLLMPLVIVLSVFLSKFCLKMISLIRLPYATHVKDSFFAYRLISTVHFRAKGGWVVPTLSRISRSLENWIYIIFSLHIFLNFFFLFFCLLFFFFSFQNSLFLIHFFLNCFWC